MSCEAEAQPGMSRSESRVSCDGIEPQQQSPDISLAKLPGWYTPKRLLALFCWVNFLVYLDRGVIACNGVNGTATSGIQVSCWSEVVQPAFCWHLVH